MRVPCIALLVCACALTVARARAEPTPPSPAPAADATSEPAKATEADEARALVTQGGADLWLVVDNLCRQGNHDAAGTLLAEFPSTSVERLVAYVASRRGKEADETARTALESAYAAISTGDSEAALATLEGVEPRGDPVATILVAMTRGQALRRERRFGESVEAYLAAGVAARDLGWFDRASESFTRAGTNAVFDADYPAGLSAYRAGLKMAEAARDRHRIANALRGAGLCLERLGDYGPAIAHQDRAMRLYRELEDLEGVAGTAVNLGGVHESLGRYARALEVLEEGLRSAEEAGRPGTAAKALHAIAGVHYAMGDWVAARRHVERARDRMQTLEQPLAVAAMTIGLGMVEAKLGDDASALQHYREALQVAEELGNRQYAASALANMAVLHRERGEYEQALVHYTTVRAIHVELGDAEGTARTTGDIGDTMVRMGDRSDGIQQLRQAIRSARRLRARPVLTKNLERLARMHLDAGDADKAIYLAREALGELEHVFSGLGGDDAAQVRSRYADLFALGTLAAARLGESADAVTFLESGRAGALLEMLGGRNALRWTKLPAELRAAESAAKRQYREAQEAYERAVAAGRRPGIRAAGEVLDEAGGSRRRVAARIQREAKGQAAGLFYPRAATLEELQEMLEEGQALVLYGLCLDEALALVLTPDDERMVALGSVAEVREACEALRVRDPDVDASEGLARLARLLVQPLALPDDIREVIISPEGPLGYVPFGALMDQAVALTPSGTTLLLLESEPHPGGTDVLALGDPSYEGDSGATAATGARGRRLLRLPGTRAEAKAVGNEVLLGAGASKAGLRAALAQRESWRAVHFACHGLVDPERPTLSSLALSADEDDDGFLTALEVLRMEIPADLVVLSACETGTGKIVNGEGILGLTRAFMYAGSPRVLCSLWMVDDEATRALMVKFYELWRGEGAPRGSGARPGSATQEGLGAAAALREAQTFIRNHPDHPEWKHPYYWAAWVLWGLPN